METMNTSSTHHPNCSTTLKTSSMQRPSRHDYETFLSHQKTMDDIDRSLNSIRSHVDFLVRTKQFDELTKTREFLSNMLTSLLDKYFSTYED